MIRIKALVLTELWIRSIKYLPLTWWGEGGGGGGGGVESIENTCDPSSTKVGLYSWIFFFFARYFIMFLLSYVDCGI